MFVRGCTQPPFAPHTCSSWHMWQAGRQRRPAQRERAQHDAQGCPHARGDTLPRHTHRGQKEGESGTHEEEAHAVRAWKTEVNRKKTEMESHLEVTEPESQGMRKDSLGKKQRHTYTEAHVQKEWDTQMN